MPVKDLHEKPFDAETLSKLEIFEQYAQAWIPIFTMIGGQHLHIFDFFAGTGYDKNGVPGSPIRILKKILEQVSNIVQKDTLISVYLNEYDSNKFELMKTACEAFLDQNQELKQVIQVFYSHDSFEIIFEKLIHIIKKFPSLLFLDQNGIKFLADTYLLEFSTHSQTDFLYFVSSSYFQRFGNTEEFQKNISLNMEEIREQPYRLIHRSLLNQLRKKIPQGSKLKLYPFSIRKQSNIYGIIFGASHIRAVDKFLGITWKHNELNGEANFDLDEDVQKSQLTLFGSKPKTKLEAFNEKLREKILSGELKTNQDIFLFTLEEGHIGSHASNVVKAMKREKLVDFTEKSPLLTYESTFGKYKRCINYILLSKR